MQSDIEHPTPHLLEDNPIHTDHDPTPYPDNVDPAILAQVAQQIQDGLLTPDEATRTVQGRQL